jgi:hypothetical protein
MMCELIVESVRAQKPISGKPFHQWAFQDGTVWTSFYRVGGSYLLRFPGMADFKVAADGSAICYPAPDVSEGTLQCLYLNQVLPLVWSKQGKLVFHGSSVEIEGGAIAFLGSTGRGKSTLAAAFATRGHRFLTDDGLLLQPSPYRYQVHPSHPSIRLWDDSEEWLIAPGSLTAPTASFTSKSRFLAGEGLDYCEQPRDLLCAYFLGDGTVQDVSFACLTPYEALAEWVKNSFLIDVEDQALLSSHFDRVATLANRLRCFYLDFPRQFVGLDRVIEAIKNHAMSERFRV